MTEIKATDIKKALGYLSRMADAFERIATATERASEIDPLQMIADAWAADPPVDGAPGQPEPAPDAMTAPLDRIAVAPPGETLASMTRIVVPPGVPQEEAEANAYRFRRPGTR